MPLDQVMKILNDEYKGWMFKSIEKVNCMTQTQDRYHSGGYLFVRLFNHNGEYGGFAFCEKAVSENDEYLYLIPYREAIHTFLRFADNFDIDYDSDIEVKMLEEYDN